MRGKRAKYLRKVARQIADGLPWLNYVYLRNKTKVLTNCGRRVYQVMKVVKPLV